LINEEIDYPEVRLILDDGGQHGIVSSSEAYEIAKERGLDLVVISPAATPPVCKVMDYGKFKFDKQKKDREARKKQRENKVELKEIKFRPKIDVHDYEVKMKHIRRFLSEGNKVKLVIRFRGREMAFQSKGIELLNKVVEDLGDLCVVDKKPEMQGRMQTMVISPK
jgi:translation initiation factor IF-3